MINQMQDFVAEQTSALTVQIQKLGKDSVETVREAAVTILTAAVHDLVRDQIELIPATRARIVEDAQRAVMIFKHAGRDVRGVVKHVYERVVEPVEDKIPEVKVKVQKRKPAAAKRAAAKTRARKTAAAAA